MKDIHMFVGPTLHQWRQRYRKATPDQKRDNELRAKINGLASMNLHPPAQLGSVKTLVQQQHSPGTLIVVDGLFHDQAAISHKELILAIRYGWQVWGLSDMGAIRAMELHSMNMKGYGQIHSMLMTDTSITDDQVLWHWIPTETDAPLAVPKIHLTHWLRSLIKGEVSLVHFQLLQDWLAKAHFRDLSTAAVTQKLHSLGLQSQADRWLRYLPDFDLKTNDFDQFLAQYPCRELPHPQAKEAQP